MNREDEETSSEVFTVLTSLGAAFVVGDFTVASGSKIAAPTRAVRCENDGTLRVKRKDGTSVDLPFRGGETQEIKASEITSIPSGTCLPITLYW